MISIEWRWNKASKTFLVIFNFDAEGKDNIKHHVRYYRVHDGPSRPFYHVSWAASHAEVAMLSQVLHYANKINGLKLREKMSLIRELTGKEWCFYSDTGAKYFNYLRSLLDLVYEMRTRGSTFKKPLVLLFSDG